MRRGHSEIGGWRNENQRHFRPRSGGNQHFRSSRTYGPPDPARFPPPSSRSARPFHSRSEKFDQNLSEYHDRHRYRHNHYNSYHRSQQPSDRQISQSIYHTRHNGDKHNNKSTFKEASTFYKDIHVDNFHVNSMGDVDHRQLPHMRESLIQPFPSTWIAESNKQVPTKELNNKTITESGEPTKLSAEYTGHRPPASDHYGCNPTHSFSAIDNSHSFSRSVNDTVDLIRKRLMNRNEQQRSPEDFVNNQNSTNPNEQRLAEKSNSLTNIQPETPTKKKYQRQKSSEKSNCAKIKNKIVHQLFKMDKKKIHKLMDNPNSSTKFEYAISSLITESQNSFNRHLRSAAEKSLCSSSVEFIQNDNNTIYEDTFMKQMQCILDPQDTILLEDIKPLVMAELTKVLQIDECEQRYDIGDDDIAFTQQIEQQICNPYPSNEYTYEAYPDSNLYDHNNPAIHCQYNENVDSTSNTYNAYDDNQLHYQHTKPISERQSRRRSYNFNEEGCSTSEPSFYNQSVNHINADKDMRPNVPQPLFNTIPEHLSEEDDPFAELDKQYHVAVDPDFIEQDDIPVPEQVGDLHKTNSITIKTELNLSDINSSDISDKLNNQLQKTPNAPSQEQIFDSEAITSYDPSVQSTQERTLNSNDIISNPENEGHQLNSGNDIKNYNKTRQKSTEMTTENEKLDHLTPVKKSASASNSRKRSIDQRPSHRKEKRKKSESCQSEPNKQILNKNIIINVNDCTSKKSENCEASKSVFNLFFSKDENKSISKENKKSYSIDKDYTEKHVKRKETPKKGNENDARTRKDSTSSQTTSPTDNNLTCNNHVQNKADGKITLKTIDMFTEQPKKINIHHAHRNTALTPGIVPKLNIDMTNKTKGQLIRQINKKHIAIQATRKFHTKDTQTEMKKFAVKAIQTEILPNKSESKATDVFERMKEIDLEIQVLLQEKFKLYNSIETKDSGKSSMQTLGMTVLNVDQFHDEENEEAENMLTEDAIVEDFANTPVEELEQIALESVDEQQNETPRVERRNRSRKISYQDSVKSESPTTVSKRKSRKTKSPNISLIEQIITDDRPLEDIISLDDLEVPQKATRSKNQKTRQISKKKKGTTKTIKCNIPNILIKECSVVLVKTDISNYFETESNDLRSLEEHEFIDETNQKDILHIEENVVGETVESLIQIDMLDVSEDIVVGDTCELKSLEDKEIIENGSVPINEEIILDNSQSSMEDTTTPAVCQGGVCKMYDYSADENLRRDSVIVTGNADAVLAIECVENNFLAACLDGNVYYFSSEGQLIATLRGSNLAVTCLTIVRENNGTTVYTGSLDSRIRYYELETGLEKGPECNVLSPIQTMDRAWDTVFVGTRTGFVLQFECKNNMLIPVSSVKFSDQSILALRAMKEGPRKVLLVAARSENVTIKDAQTGLLLRTLEGPKMTVYTLLYEDGKVYCGTSSHQIHVFDYTSGGHVGTHEGGKGAVCLRAYGGLLFAGCYDGCVYVYREGEGQPLAQIRGPSLMLLSLAVIGSKIFAGYKDRSLYIWKIPLCILEEMIL